MNPAKHIPREWIASLALAAVTLAVYWPVRQHAFINFDDPNYITENRHVQAGLTRSGLAWAFFNLHGEHSYWHPVTWVSHMLDCQLFGLNPGPHHLVNVGFHITNTLLLLLVLRRITGAFWRSAMVAALFALHPLQVDTVAWVTERKNVLSTFFWLLTLWAYARYADLRSLKSKVQGREVEVQGSGFRVLGSGRPVPRAIFHLPSSIFYLLSLLLFALGLMSKPALVTLPFVLLLLDYWPLGRLKLRGGALGERRPNQFEVQSSKFEVRGSTPAQKEGLLTRAATQQPSFRRLVLEKLPFLALSAAAAVITVAGHDELRATAHLPWSWRVANALVSYTRYLGKTFWPTHLAVFYPHPGTWPAGMVVASAGALLVVSGWVIWRARQAPYLVVGWLWFLGVLVPMIGLIQAGGQAMADRFAYVPMIGLFIMIVWGGSDWASRPAQRSADLQSAVPRISNPQGAGSTRDAGRLKTCVTADCKSALQGWRGHGPGVSGSILVSLLTLGACTLLTSRQLSYWQNTTTLFEHALKVTSNNACAHYSLGYALADEGKMPEAMQEWEIALKIEPGLADIHGKIASTLCRQGDFAGAIARYHRALEVDPDLGEALNNLAWLLATCPEASLRNGPEAVQLALKACQLTRFRRTIMVGTFAAAYAEAGLFTEAVATAQKACALAKDEDDGTLLARNQQLLELYRAGQPYHEPATK